MKTSVASVIFALLAALSVSCIPVRREIEELSSRSQLIGIKARVPIPENNAIPGRSPAAVDRRDDITIIEARDADIEKREAISPSSADAGLNTRTATLARDFSKENGAEKRTLTLASNNATAPGLFREVPVKQREAKVIEPPCFKASTTASDIGCVVNLKR